MNGKLAEAYVEIGAELNPFNRALAAVHGRLNKLAATRFTFPGGGFVALLGGAALVTGIGKSIKAASDLNETVSKVGVTFGNQASIVTKASDEMADAFGIPKQEFLDAASQFGLIATGMGESQEAAAKMSTRFAKLAADAASFYNVPVDVALEKIRAGLTGESEPLKAFSVFMDETSMKAEAQRLGLVRAGQELDNRSKLVARAALIEKGLAAAEGDLARTFDGTANQARTFSGAMENLSAQIGGSLLPAADSVIRLLNTFARDLSKAAQDNESAWSTMVASISDGVDTLGLIYRNWGDIVERTGISIGGNLQNVSEYFTHLGDVVKTFLEWFATNWPTIINDTVKASMGSIVNLIDIIKDPQAAVAKLVSGGFAGKQLGFGDLLANGIKIETPAINLPKLQLTDFSDQLRAVDDKMAAREAAKAQGKPGAGQGVGQDANAAGAAGAVAKPQKVGIIDFEAYNRELQDAALQKDDTQKKMLEVQQKQLAALNGIKEGLSRPRMGIGAAAVFG